MFVNRISFGQGLTGIEVESQRYFGKDPKQLNIAESAFLAGLIRAPSYFLSVKHPERVFNRRNEVIDAMAARHLITLSEAQSAKLTPLTIETN